MEKSPRWGAGAERDQPLTDWPSPWTIVWQKWIVFHIINCFTANMCSFSSLANMGYIIFIDGSVLLTGMRFCFGRGKFLTQHYRNLARIYAFSFQIVVTDRSLLWPVYALFSGCPEHVIIHLYTLWGICWRIRCFLLAIFSEESYDLTVKQFHPFL
jgi:hypothetical protein